MRKNLASTLFSILLIMSCNTVSAVTCSDVDSGVFDNESDLNSIATACFDANVNNDSQDALNSAEFFGITSWSLLGKIDDGQSSDLIDLDVDSIGNVSGSFSFDSSIWDDDDEIIVVLKGGVTSVGGGSARGGKPAIKGKPAVTGKPDIVHGVKWSAYLLTQDVYEGFWIYGHGSKGQLKDLSHLSIYGSGTAVIPVPAAVWLFGSGLIALAVVSRRKLR